MILNLWEGRVWTACSHRAACYFDCHSLRCIGQNNKILFFLDERNYKDSSIA